MKEKIIAAIKAIGVPRIIIFAFFILVVFGASHYNLGLPSLLVAFSADGECLGFLSLQWYPEFNAELVQTSVSA